MPVKKYQDPATMVIGAKKKASSKTPKEALSKAFLRAPRTPSGSEVSLILPPPSGSVSRPQTYNKEYLKEGWNRVSGRMMAWLQEGTRLEDMLAETKLKDIGIMMGIATEKVLLMSGQPTQIIAETQHKKLDELVPALLAEVQRRGASVELTERKANVTLGPGSTSKT